MSKWRQLFLEMNNPVDRIENWGVDSSWTLFLDRDGTINERIEGYITEWEEFHFLAKAIDAIAGFSSIFGKIIVVTNQQGIDKELMTHEDLNNIHAKMMEVLDYFDGRIDEIYYEPSLAVYDSPRRKPDIGMGLDAQKDFPSINFRKSIMIGDTLSDMQFGKKLGMKTVWIKNTMELKNQNEINKFTDFSVSSLYDFLLHIQ